MNPTRFISQFTEEQILQEIDILKIRNRYFLANQEQRDFIIKSRIIPYYFGIYLGEEAEKFKPSFFLLELLKAHAKRVVVNEKAAWLFLCGRNILHEGIIKIEKLQEKDLVLVVNEREEILGYGQNLGKTIKNRFDRGDFLRRERADEKR